MKKFRDISIKDKLYFTVGLMAVLIIIELTTLWFSVHTLSAVRAFVGGEGLWSKGEKDAIYELRKYGETHDEKDYQAFLKFMSVPLGDHKARIELMKPSPNMDVVRKGFLEGRNHPDDIESMINLVVRFHNISYIHKAIEIWTVADISVARFIPLADSMHALMQNPNISQQKIDALVSEIDPINTDITVLEDNFSYTLGAGSRWLEDLVLKLLFAVALTVEITGLTITFTVSRSISRGLNEIIRSTHRISQGDLKDRAKVLSEDEIGTVAQSINRMADQLIRSNQELGQFAYIASHDLQEPLRTITNFSNLLNEDYNGQLDEKGEKYLQFITQAAVRMQNQIRDLLEYSRIGADVVKSEVDCNALVREVLTDLQASIENNKAKITVNPLPRVTVTPDFKLLLQNLLSNAMKYHKPNVPPQIEISAQEHGREWLFCFRDNGIGVPAKYHDKIFVIFQKLHSRKEYEGTGIGLAQCKKIAELNGGHIWVESVEGQGSVFYFTVPKFASI
jgi:hypothetical protein